MGSQGFFFPSAQRRSSRVHHSLAPHPLSNAPSIQVLHPTASTPTLLTSAKLLWLLERLTHTYSNPCHEPLKWPMPMLVAFGKLQGHGVGRPGLTAASSTGDGEPP